MFEKDRDRHCEYTKGPCCFCSVVVLTILTGKVISVSLMVICWFNEYWQKNYTLEN